MKSKIQLMDGKIFVLIDLNFTNFDLNFFIR